MHMGSPALQGRRPLVALQRVRCQRGCIAPQAGLLQRGNALLWQPCMQPSQALSCALGGTGIDVLMTSELRAPDTLCYPQVAVYLFPLKMCKISVVA